MSFFGRFSHFRSAFPKYSRMFSTEKVKSKGRFIAPAIGLIFGYFLGGELAQRSRRTHAKQIEAALNPNEFKKFFVDGVEELNHNTKILRFKLETPETPLGLPVASCILTKAPLDKNGKDVVRPYTPITPADTLGYFELLVKSYPQGVMSRHIHSLKAGDFLEIKGPISKIPYKANMKKKIGMIAGGTGVTPMLQLLNEILSNPKDKTEVTLVFANLAEEDILLKDKLNEFANKHKNFKVYYVLERPPKNWKGGVGYVSEDIVTSKLPPPSDDNLIMVCGPPGMMNAISGPKAPDYTQGELDGILKKLGYTKSQVFKF